MSSLPLAQWLQFAVMLLTIIGLGLSILGHVGSISKNAATMTVLAAAQRIVNQIIAVLQADPSVSKPALVAKGVRELQTNYKAEIAKMAFPTALVEPILSLIIQRLIAGVPAGLSMIINDIENTPKAAGAMGGVYGGVSPMTWSKQFNRGVGED